MYCYDYPRPSVTVDIVLLTDAFPHPQVLLIRRKNPPFKNLWALLGVFLEMDETLEASVLRELHEETSVAAVHLTQIGTFGHPNRAPADVSLLLLTLALLIKRGRQTLPPVRMHPKSRGSQPPIYRNWRSTTVR